MCLPAVTVLAMTQQAQTAPGAQNGAETRDAGTLAVLIDADNAQAELLGAVLAEAAKFGTVAVRRIYGDWTSSHMAGWKHPAQIHAVQPVQQFNHAAGKNSTDMALAIDAMDLLHSQRMGGFCVVSSDSDFTRLATRIREQGLLVMGIGRRDTPKAFVAACEFFVYTENLQQAALAALSDATPNASESHNGWTGMVADAVQRAQREDGWAPLSRVGSLLQQTDPGFDPRSYGVSGGRLSVLVGSRPDLFELTGGETGGGQLLVRSVDDTA